LIEDPPNIKKTAIVGLPAIGENSGAHLTTAHHPHYHSRREGGKSTRGNLNHALQREADVLRLQGKAWWSLKGKQVGPVGTTSKKGY